MHADSCWKYVQSWFHFSSAKNSLTSFSSKKWQLVSEHIILFCHPIIPFKILVRMINLFSLSQTKNNTQVCVVCLHNKLFRLVTQQFFFSAIWIWYHDIKNYYILNGSVFVRLKTLNHVSATLLMNLNWSRKSFFFRCTTDIKWNLLYSHINDLSSAYFPVWYDNFL